MLFLQRTVLSLLLLGQYCFHLGQAMRIVVQRVKSASVTGQDQVV